LEGAVCRDTGPTRRRAGTRGYAFSRHDANRRSDEDPRRRGDRVLATGRYAWRGLEVSGAVNGSGAYELESLDGRRTRLTLALHYESTRLAGRLQLPMIRIMAPRILRTMLDQLDQLFHADQAATEPRA
jgi:hypothetical protein